MRANASVIARFVPPASALLASIWGFYVYGKAASRGEAYPNELTTPLVLAILPIGFALAAWFQMRLLSAIAYVAYVLASIVSGFGYGGPHLTVGLPLLTLGLFVLFARKKQASPRLRAPS